MKKILVIGSLNLDMTVQVDHTPVVGETILSNKMEMNAGGKGANQACALGKLGADVIMLGAVGRDMYADIQMDSLNKAGVDTTRVIVKDEVSTGIALITVNRDGDNSIIVVSGANATLSKQDIDDNLDVIKESDI
ncbi:PfkB family carbohydrate kinase, partial [Blautia pseudococcoides]|nr:PfkB family carbohydrate kinase [Blautia pseudococcoides]